MANQANTDIDAMLKEINARQKNYMAEARAIVAACKAKNNASTPRISSTIPTARKIDIASDGSFVFDGAKYNIAADYTERVITVTFHKFRYNTTESELMNAGIEFGLNDNAVNYCIAKWLKNER